jgi:hypothetical protein
MCQANLHSTGLSMQASGTKATHNLMAALATVQFGRCSWCACTLPPPCITQGMHMPCMHHVT